MIKICINCGIEADCYSLVTSIGNKKSITEEYYCPNCWERKLLKETRDILDNQISLSRSIDAIRKKRGHVFKSKFKQTGFYMDRYS